MDDQIHIAYIYHHLKPAAKITWPNLGDNTWWDGRSVSNVDTTQYLEVKRCENVANLEKKQHNYWRRWCCLPNTKRIHASIQISIAVRPSAWKVVIVIDHIYPINVSGRLEKCNYATHRIYFVGGMSVAILGWRYTAQFGNWTDILRETNCCQST